MMATLQAPPPAATVRATLAVAAAELAAAGIVTARLDAELLLAAVVDRDRTWVHTHAPAPLAEEARQRFATWLRRRCAREPLAYIVGEQEFWSLSFTVTRDVLIPRPETELLVETAILHLRHATPAPRVCDVGTGSGCIAIALANELPQARITAVDTSTAALRLAAANAGRHRVDARITFHCGDLLTGLYDRFHLIASNPPYVDAGERGRLQPELAYEPDQALYAREQGLAEVRRLLEQAPARLEPGGVVLIEIGATQAEEAARLARAAGFTSVDIENDLAGLPRLLVARG